MAIVRDTTENARAYFREHPIPFPCLADEGRQVYDLYGVATEALSLGQRPGLFVIDRQGTVRFAHIGRQQWDIPGNAEVLEVCGGIPCAAEA